MPEYELNEAQALAIKHASGPMQVLAGPGSGKTYLTIRRIRHLIRHHGISPDKILVITFTKAAAAEMKERFLELTDSVWPQVHFGTFHAVYFHILRQSGYSGLKLASLADKQKCLRHILHMIDIPEDNNTELLKQSFSKQSFNEQSFNEQLLIERLIKQISIVKNCGEDISTNMIPGNFCEGVAEDEYEQKLVSHFPFIYEEYCRIMRDDGRIDFDDMIFLCDRLFQEKTDILSYWQKAFPYILIDEFQDISPLQYKIIRSLALPCNNLFVVGDDDQSIYGFRGAGPDIMKQFIVDYPEARQLQLSINYRCSKTIVEAAQIVIADNKKRFKKEITSNQKTGEKVKILSFDTKENEYAYLAASLKKKSIKELEETAVIYRTNAETAFFSRQLASLHIPFYIKEKITNIFEQPIALDIISYLAFAEDSFGKKGSGGRRSDFFRIMNKPSRYIHRAAVSASVVTLEELLGFYTGKSYMQEILRVFFVDIKRISQLRPYLAIDYIRKSMGYNIFLYEGNKKAEQEKAKELADNIQETAAGFHTFHEWREYITEYSNILKCGQKDISADAGGVKLITMHASKGLEYTHVYLPDVKTGHIPNKKAVLEEQLEEERRLFYVAMTRAKKYLEILYYDIPSPFINELEMIESKQRMPR